MNLQVNSRFSMQLIDDDNIYITHKGIEFELPNQRKEVPLL